jgi:hypothetical protein
VPTITTRITFWNLATFGLILLLVAIAMYAAFSSNEVLGLDRELAAYADVLLARSERSPETVSQLFGAMQNLASDANLRYQSLTFLLFTADSTLAEEISNVPLDTLIDSVRSYADSLIGTPERT